MNDEEGTARQGRYVITHGRTRAEAETSALQAGDGWPVLFQTARELPEGGWVVRGEVLEA
ncbi:MAG: hypothetical protein DI630_16430 [Gordonia sp. (in: high G+C Gram-positive bacteria)]|nr:MAG: hypothetical protein DI630_16430 [Gordonia sp. (in: high G+C Gram-positive bacteria)]